VFLQFCWVDGSFSQPFALFCSASKMGKWWWMFTVGAGHLRRWWRDRIYMGEGVPLGCKSLTHHLLVFPPLFFLLVFCNYLNLLGSCSDSLGLQIWSCIRNLFLMICATMCADEKRDWKILCLLFWWGHCHICGRYSVHTIDHCLLAELLVLRSASE
jgi:hypothetical protein